MANLYGNSDNRKNHSRTGKEFDYITGSHFVNSMPQTMKSVSEYMSQPNPIKPMAKKLEVLSLTLDKLKQTAKLPNTLESIWQGYKSNFNPQSVKSTKDRLKMATTIASTLQDLNDRSHRRGSIFVRQNARHMHAIGSDMDELKAQNGIMANTQNHKQKVKRTKTRIKKMGLARKIS
jgi:hypothetical protein